MTNPNETPEPLAQEQAREMPVVAYLVTNLSSGEPSICFEDERGDYGDEDHMPVFDELCRRSEFTAALQAKDAEIAGLKAELDKTSMLFAVSCNHGAIREMDAKAQRYDLLRRGQHWSVIDGIGDTLRAEALDSAIDAAMKGEAA